MNDTVWTYWEGPRPAYIVLCLGTMQRVLGDRFRLVTPTTISNYLPIDALHPRWRKLDQPALRADCIRAALLAVHGGWWWDADTIALKPPKLEGSVHYMTWTKPPRRILNGYIHLTKELAKPWLHMVNDSLASRKIDWCDLGEKLLTNHLSSLPEAIEIPRRMCLPIDIDSSVEKFFRYGHATEYIEGDTVCFGLNHSYFMYHHKKEMELPASQWASSPLLIHTLLHHAKINK